MFWNSLNFDADSFTDYSCSEPESVRHRLERRFGLRGQPIPEELEDEAVIRRVPNEELKRWNRETRPLRYFMHYKVLKKLEHVERFNRRVRDAWYYLKCTVWHRYNVVKCDKIGPTWIEPSDLMFHCCFQLLVQHIEGQEPDLMEKPDLDQYMRERGEYDDVKRVMDDYMRNTEIYELYWWYKKYEPYHNNSDKIEQVQLQRLIKVRQCLWT